jgi:hypothetical protein
MISGISFASIPSKYHSISSGGVGTLGNNRIILLDTNIIIEAVRVECWNGLRGSYDLVTVEKCREEAQSGFGRRPGYVDVKDEHLEKGLDIVTVTDRDRFRLAIECQEANALDTGERELWAHALSRPDDWRAACADTAAVLVALRLGWGDRLVSLEELLRSARISTKVPLKGHYTRQRLNLWRTEFELGK